MVWPYSNSSSSLINIKHWIADHGNGETVGGLAVIGINTQNWTFSTVPFNSPFHANEKYISAGGVNGSGHAMTIVGYNDEVFIQDINQDGNYTTDIDVNGDGVINIKDFEKGAFKLANSWGSGWNPPNGGYILIPYRLFIYGAPGFVMNYAYTCDAFSNQASIPTPIISIKANIEHTARKRIQQQIGYAPTSNSLFPTEMTSLYSFNFQGGINNMRGTYTGPIDIGLNFGYFYGNDNFGKIFYQINEDDENGYSIGKINSFSIIDHRWGEDFELPCSETNVSINNNSATTLSIEYQLLPHSDDFILVNYPVNSNRVSRFITTVKNNAELSIANGSTIDMYNSEIYISTGSSLKLENDTKIVAQRGVCKISIDGNITIGDNVKFEAKEGAYLEISLLNSGNTITLQGASFDRVTLLSSVATLTINQCFFSNCNYLYSKMGNVTYSNCIFDNTGIYLETDSRRIDDVATVIDCKMTNNVQSLNGITLSSYANYSISDNSIQGYYNGVDLCYAGAGEPENQLIENNSISFSQMNGIIAYSSYGSVYKNTIFNNYYGVRFMNNCSFSLHGNPNAQTLSQTQEIKDNTNIEVYASENSFPWYVRYNSIVDSDNIGAPTDPLFRWDRPSYASPTKADVAFNNWGTGFLQSQDLMGNNVIYLTNPIWTPGAQISVATPDEDLYNSACSNFKDGNYTVAKNLYHLLIQTYPSSSYSEAAMKDLIRLEEYYGHNYVELQEYYLNNDSINNNSTLSKLAEISINQCNIKLENYNAAVDWLEERIDCSSNTADSIFAIIDLGYVYSLMEDEGLKLNYIGRYPEFRPKNKKEFVSKKNYLLTLLPSNIVNSSHVQQIVPGRLLNCYPNPSHGNIAINYSLDYKSNIIIKLIDNYGKTLVIIDEGNKAKGLHLLNCNLSDLPNGTYIYSLYADGKLIDSKKLIIK